MKLIIAEKREVAESIANTLSSRPVAKNGYFECQDISANVTYALGHLLRLKEPEAFSPDYKKWALDHLPLSWPVEMEPNPNTRKQLRIVLGLIKKASSLVCATDTDAAGQCIFDAIIEYSGSKLPTQRALINDNNLIAKSFENLQPNVNFRGLYLEELGRQISDMRFGINLTRLITCQAQAQNYQTKQPFVVGRVKSVILGLVVRRQRQRETHQEHFYYQVGCESVVGNAQLSLKYQPSDTDPVDDKGRLAELSFAQSIANRINGQQLRIEDNKETTTTTSGPLPFDLLSLQVEANRVIGGICSDPEKVLEITQTLRDKYRAITYNRSDCRYLNDESFADAPGLIQTIKQIPELEPLASITQPSIKSRAFNSSRVTAHTGIIPTGNISGVDEMTDEEFDVYSLIVRNYLLQFLPKKEELVNVIHATVDGLAFTAKYRTLIHHGWEIAFMRDESFSDDEDEANDDLVPQTNLSMVTPGLIGTATGTLKTEKTRPLQSYTMRTLLRDLMHTAKYVDDPKIKAMLLSKDEGKQDTGGIGTAATRTGILKELFERGQLVEDKKNIIPTEAGYLLYDLLPDAITSPTTTAIWSHKQSQIRNGNMSVPQFVEQVQELITRNVVSVKQNGLDIPHHQTVEQKTEQCPKCSGSASMVNGKFGQFFSCKNCNSNFSALNGKIFYKPCPECSSQLKVINGNKGEFIGCSGYDKGCRYTEQI
ncbi:DNA topoisomerase [Photobacterium lutimaris]|uniref:DNA topoisomerase n=1 Tax=Photobacterium lutimaris TaxID=388278 RepID=UPI0010608D57|nr:DNA topoisomerase [Photobacterium lutimaris]TDR72528.1 DNA topoisomerase-3 [Photobacterium lutimaris]